jgi:hypothetical protein
MEHQMEKTPLRRKKPTQNMVSVGTHVPYTIKMTLEEMAAGQKKTMYEFLQDILIPMAEEFEKNQLPPSIDAAELLGSVENEDSDLLG